MSYIEFDDALKVGNKIIDHEHASLIEYINLLEKAVSHESSGNIIGKVLNGLVEYTKTHFFVEEEFMQVYHYPQAESHRKAHEAFKDKVLLLCRELEQGKAEVSSEVLKFLKEWLTEHILKTDKKLSEFLQDKTLA